jgi:hypothetical protein
MQKVCTDDSANDIVRRDLPPLDADGVRRKLEQANIKGRESKRLDDGSPSR